MNNIGKRLGENIRIRRDALGLTQDDLARIVGVTPQAIFKIETSRTQPRRKTLASIASALKCSADDLNGVPSPDTLTLSDGARLLLAYEKATPDIRQVFDSAIEASLAGVDLNQLLSRMSQSHAKSVK